MFISCLVQRWCWVEGASYARHKSRNRICQNAVLKSRSNTNSKCGSWQWGSDTGGIGQHTCNRTQENITPIVGHETMMKIKRLIHLSTSCKCSKVKIHGFKLWLVSVACCFVYWSLLMIWWVSWPMTKKCIGLLALWVCRYAAKATTF